MHLGSEHFMLISELLIVEPDLADNTVLSDACWALAFVVGNAPAEGYMSTHTKKMELIPTVGDSCAHT